MTSLTFRVDKTQNMGSMMQTLVGSNIHVFQKMMMMNVMLLLLQLPPSPPPLLLLLLLLMVMTTITVMVVGMVTVALMRMAVV